MRACVRACVCSVCKRCVCLLHKGMYVCSVYNTSVCSMCRGLCVHCDCTKCMCVSTAQEQVCVFVLTLQAVFMLIVQEVCVVTI